MGVQEMVGSITLTFFCNRCVELFHEFQQNGVLTDELKATCQRAVRAFESLKWPMGGDLVSDEKVPLFSTNEEVRSFEQALGSKAETVDRATLDKWIQKLEVILSDDIDVDQKKHVAGELQGFFDTLGDYSSYATRESLRSSGIALSV